MQVASALRVTPDQPFAERAQQARAIAAPGAAVHACQRGGRFGCQVFDQLPVLVECEK
jgi:hypothetical protein